MNKIPLPWFALLIVCGMLLGACAPAATEAPAPTQAPAAVEKTTVNLWHTIPGDTEKFFNEQLMPVFAEAHPECNVAVHNYGTEDPAVIAAGLAAGPGQGPDMWWIASASTGSYVENDVLADVDGWLNDHPDIKANIIPSLLALSSYEGKVRSLPWMTNDTAMYLNVDAFNKAGVAIPSQDPTQTWTWEEFRAAMKEVTAANPGMKGFLVTVGGPVWDFWTFDAWYAAAGGDTTKIADLSSPAAIKVAQFQRSLIDDGSTAFSEPNQGWDPAPFLAQKVAVQANGPWNFSALVAIEDFESTVVPYPRDVKPAANLGGDQLFIGKSPDPKVEACAFAFGEYMLSDDFQIAFQINSGNLPVTESAAASQKYQDHLKAYPFLAGFVNEVPYGVARQPIPQYSDIANLFSLAWDDVMLNNKPIDTVFPAAQQEAEKLFE